MSARRFTEKPDLNPTGVIALAEDHAAMRENRTLFPSTVVTVTKDEPARLLVSGMAQPNFDQAVIRLAGDLNSSRFHAARVLLYRAASNLSSGRQAA